MALGGALGSKAEDGVLQAIEAWLIQFDAQLVTYVFSTAAQEVSDALKH